jgi:hypothetical protein
MVDMTAWWPAMRSRAPDAGVIPAGNLWMPRRWHPRLTGGRGFDRRSVPSGEAGEGFFCGAASRLAPRQIGPGISPAAEKLLGWKEQLLPKHPMADAVNYALNQWDELNLFCSDGAVAIDNNVSEREMKRIILNRKNSLFVGNSRGGRTAAILASLTSTCRRHEVDPQLYLTQLLMNLPQAKMSELSNRLPDQWKIRHLARMASFNSNSSARN